MISNPYHFNRVDVLKASAILLMLCDHWGLFFVPDNPYYRIVGRSVVPLLFINAGYFYDKGNRDREVLCLGLYMTLCQYLIWKSENLLPLDTIISLVAGRWLSARINRPFWLLSSIASTVMIIATGKISYTSAIVTMPLVGRALKDGARPLLLALLIIAALVIYSFGQSIGRGYTTYQISLLIIVVFLTLMASMWVFTRPKALITSRSLLLSQAVCFISKYTLEIYFIHACVFALTSRALYPS